MKKIITFLLVLVVALNFCHSNKKQSIGQNENVFNRSNLPASHFSISSDRDTIIKSNAGTKIKISKNTFVDSGGQLFHGHVNIELKEAISKQDIVLGNMTTLSNNDVLESGGMIYINATSDNSNLEIAENSSIEVSIPAENKNEQMQIYSAEFDKKTYQINWVNPKDIIVKENLSDTGRTQMSQLISVTQSSHDSARHLNEVENLLPPKMPEQYKRGIDTTISLVFDTSSFPELSQYRNVKFKLRDNSNFDPKDSKRIWMSLDLKKTEVEGIYIISFSALEKNGLVERSYKVSPVFEAGSDYKTAMAEYNKKYEEFEKKKADIEEQRKEDERKQKLAEEKAQAEWQKEFAEQQRQMKLVQQNQYISDPNTNYIFNMKKLGWVNIDCSYNIRKVKPVELITKIENQKDFDTIFISLVLGNAKVLLPGYQKEDHTYGFNTSEDNIERLPIDEPATIFSTAYKNGKPYFGISKIIISKKQSVSIQLMETTLDKIKEEIKNKI